MRRTYPFDRSLRREDGLYVVLAAMIMTIVAR
jgi:hypothetical protein